MNTQNEGTTFEGWAIVELMGHRKLGGYCKEETVFGSSFLRLDIPDSNGGAVATQFYNPSSIYCLTPCAEELAKQYSLKHQPQPVTRWELPQVKAIESTHSVDEFYDQYEDEE